MWGLATCRYSTMLHIISITEIKFRRLTRQVLGMQTTQEEQPTVEETIDLVREMQAIRPQTPPAEPEADYGQYSQGHLGGALVSTVIVIVEGVWSVQTVRATVSTGSQGYGQYRQSGLWSVQVGLWSVQTGL